MTLVQEEDEQPYCLLTPDQKGHRNLTHLETCMI